MNKNHNHKKCSSKLISRVKQNSLNLTSIRKKVLEIIAASHKPAKAYDILDKLKGEGFSDKPPTVYRALDFLMKNNLVHKLNTINAYAACFNNEVEEEISCFLICEQCQNIEELQDNKLIQAINEFSKNRKINKKNINLEIGYKCEECQS